MSTIKIVYAASASITCSLASLANGSSQSSASVDNSSNLYDDALLQIAVKTSSSALGNRKQCWVYLYSSEDGTNFNVTSGSGGGNEMAAGAVGTDANVTLSPYNRLKGPYVIHCPASSTTYRIVIPIAQSFNRRMPRKWGFILSNFTNQALDSTGGNHIKSYTGIYYSGIS